MKYTHIEGIEKPVSRIVFGCSNDTMNGGGDFSEVLDAALEAGINTFDTARVYGKSERSLGRWLRSGRREDVIVETKCCHPSLLRPDRVTAKDIMTDFDRSLGELGTDYADILLLHRDNAKADTGSIMECLTALKESGRIRAFGVSNWTHGRIAEANAYAEAHGLEKIALSSPHFGLAVQHGDPWGGCVTISGDNAAARKWYIENGMPIFAYSGLARGLMSGRYRADDQTLARKLDAPTRRGYLYEDNLRRLERAFELAEAKGCTVAQLSVAWMFAQGLDVCAILSQSSPKRVSENAAACDVVITEEESEYLDLKREKL